MKITNQNNIQFQGYKNLIHNNLRSDYMHMMFMSMQLDNKEHNDLDEFNQVRKLMGKESDSDVLNVVFSKFADREGFLFFDNRSMYSGEELIELSKNVLYKQEEKATLKAYTLLASITRRMMQNGLCQTDSGFKNVVQSSIESFVKLLGADSSKIFTLIQSSVIENKQIERTAEEFNNIIVRRMSKFFK